MIIRVETWIDNQPGLNDQGTVTHETTRDIDYRRKADRMWLAKHQQWAFNNGRGIQTYRVR